MRSPDDIQRAHDILVSLILDPAFWAAADGDTLLALMAQADVLCWILHHDHNTRFALALESIEKRLAEYGVVIVDTGCLQTREEQ